MEKIFHADGSLEWVEKGQTVARCAADGTSEAYGSKLDATVLDVLPEGVMVLTSGVFSKTGEALPHGGAF